MKKIVLVELIIRYLGYALFAVGSISFIRQLLDCTSSLGALFYTLAGGSLIIFYSKFEMPATTYSSLFEKSLLDLSLEPSPMNNLYILLFLSQFKSPDELKRIANQLPPQAQFIIQPGIVNLLPSPIGSILTRCTIKAEQPPPLPPPEVFNNDPALPIRATNDVEFLTLVGNELKQEATRVYNRSYGALRDYFRKLWDTAGYSYSTLIQTAVVGYGASYGLKRLEVGLPYSSVFRPLCRIGSYIGSICGAACTAMLVLKDVQNQWSVSDKYWMRLRSCLVVMVAFISTVFNAHLKSLYPSVKTHSLKWFRRIVCRQLLAKYLHNRGPSAAIVEPIQTQIVVHE